MQRSGRFVTVVSLGRDVIRTALGVGSGEGVREEEAGGGGVRGRLENMDEAVEWIAVHSWRFG